MGVWQGSSAVRGLWNAWEGLGRGVRRTARRWRAEDQQEDGGVAQVRQSGRQAVRHTDATSNTAQLLVLVVVVILVVLMASGRWFWQYAGSRAVVVVSKPWWGAGQPGEEHEHEEEAGGRLAQVGP